MRSLVLLCFLAFAVCRFPPDFKFGVATAAFQIEGAWLQDDKGLSLWDNLAHLPDYIADGRAPDIAANSYNLYAEDIELMKKAGIKNYRMSISWPRIVPEGRAHRQINTKAVKRYREMFELMLQAGITPHVTLYHWDLPATLFLQGYDMVDLYLKDNFLYYANASFSLFGDLVKNWYTFNEPWCMVMLKVFNDRDKETKPYLSAHNILLTHAATVKLFRDNYQQKNGGTIGIVLNSDMLYPRSETNPDDVKAVNRGMDFFLGWFADPIFLGDYPEVMKERLGDRLPKFTEEEKELLKGSSDFFGLNHYTSYLASDPIVPLEKGYWRDRNVNTTKHDSWNTTDMNWPIVPKGIHDLLVFINDRYKLKEKNIPIFITENGMANSEPTPDKAENDQPRIHYLRTYLEQVEKAIDEGINVKGYFLWSLLDNFEWREGFSKRFGIVRVEFTDQPTRKPKASYYWYSDFIKAHSNQASSPEFS